MSIGIGKKEVEVTVSPIKAAKDLSTLKKKDIPLQKGTKAEAKDKAVKAFKKATSSKGRDKYGFLNGSKVQQVWSALIEDATASSLEKICSSKSAVLHIIAALKKPLGVGNYGREAKVEIKDGKMKVVKFELPKSKEEKKPEVKK